MKNNIKNWILWIRKILTLRESCCDRSNFSCNRSKSFWALSRDCCVFSVCNWYFPEADCFNTKKLNLLLLMYLLLIQILNPLGIDNNLIYITWDRSKSSRNFSISVAILSRSVYDLFKACCILSNSSCIFSFSVWVLSSLARNRYISPWDFST